MRYRALDAGGHVDMTTGRITESDHVDKCHARTSRGRDLYGADVAARLHQSRTGKGLHRGNPFSHGLKRIERMEPGPRRCSSGCAGTSAHAVAAANRARAVGHDDGRGEGAIGGGIRIRVARRATLREGGA
jgi:hypothetical protein